MFHLSPAETVELSIAALRFSAPLTWRRWQAAWRVKAASAFYQAGVERHRRLFLSEIIADFEASDSERDGAHAAVEKGLLHKVDDEAHERIAWYYETALAYAPGFAEPLYNLAALRRDSGCLDEAFALFLRAAQARPHRHARPHALVVANAFWEAASIAATRGRLGEAETLFRRALHLHGNFGPEHVRFPRLLQRLGKNEEALDHFELITTYSHRYAAEFIEPDYGPDELLPRNPDGTSFDPSEMTRINGGEIFYWAHLYFHLKQANATNVIELRKLLSRHRPIPLLWLARTPIRCSQTKGALKSRN
jgi:tetratricopeptide (TPR) repeat protein